MTDAAAIIVNQLGQEIVELVDAAGGLDMPLTVASYRIKQALLAQGMFGVVRDARLEPPDEFTLRWDAEAPVMVGDVVAKAIQAATGYTDIQMTTLFASAVLVP